LRLSPAIKPNVRASAAHVVDVGDVDIVSHDFIDALCLFDRHRGNGCPLTTATPPV